MAAATHGSGAWGKEPATLRGSEESQALLDATGPMSEISIAERDSAKRVHRSLEPVVDAAETTEGQSPQAPRSSNLRGRGSAHTVVSHSVSAQQETTSAGMASGARPDIVSAKMEPAQEEAEASRDWSDNVSAGDIPTLVQTTSVRGRQI